MPRSAAPVAAATAAAISSWSRWLRSTVGSCRDQSWSTHSASAHANRAGAPPHGPDRVPVARGLGDREMEARVDRRIGRSSSAPPPAGTGRRPRRAGCARGQAGDRRLEGHAELVVLPQLGRVARGGVGEGRREGARLVGDDGVAVAAAARHQQPLGGEFAQRLAHRHTADAEPLGQHALGRQPVARPQLAEREAGADGVRDDAVRRLVLQRQELDGGVRRCGHGAESTAPAASGEARGAS